MPTRNSPVRRFVTLAVLGYAVAVAASWLLLETLTDRAWPVTLIAYGPRWVLALPLPVAFGATFSTGGRAAVRVTGTLTLAGLVLLFGVMDFRLGLGRTSAEPLLRILTQNLGGSQVTAEALDRSLAAQHVDVAALQECPFYDYAPERLGWHFYYGGDLCLMSRFPFAVIDEPDPENAWKSSHNFYQFEIETPGQRLRLLNVHLGTIRGGLEALGATGWRGLGEFAANREQARSDSRRALEKSRQSTAPLVVAGDFNLPIESAIYRTDWQGLQNGFSRCGRGLGHTKFTGLFGIRIDHVLMSRQWECVDARVVASVYDGDHAALVVDLVRRDERVP